MRPSGSLILGLIIFLAAANLFVVGFIKKEHYIYFWDYSIYWENVMTITERFPKNPYNTIKELYLSVAVRGDDYNLFPAFLLMPVALCFGSGRLAYILSIVNVFAFPAAVSFALLNIKLNKLSLRSSPIPPLIAIALVLLSPNFWNPILFGYLDVGGVAIINTILLLYLRRYFSEQTTRDAVLIGLLIPILILFRRWYAFWAVSFYIASFLEQCCFVSLKSAFRLKSYGRIMLKMILPMSISALFLVAVAPTFTFRAVTTNYADIYSAYGTSLFGSIVDIIDWVGLLAFSLFLAGTVQAIFDKTSRRFSLFLSFQWAIMFFLFARTQWISAHHLYLFLPSILLFSALFLTRLVSRYGTFVFTAVVLLLTMNFLAGLSADALWPQKPFSWILTDSRHSPLVRNDIEEIDRMLDVLSKTLTNFDDRVYVLASSTVLNSSIVRNAPLSLNRYAEISTKILQTHDLDKRDGFPERLLTANYVIVADPIQYHVRPSDQRVIGIPAEMILTGKNIGRSFVKLPYRFELDRDVKCYIYKKLGEFDSSDLTALTGMLKGYYPDRPSIYQIK